MMGERRIIPITPNKRRTPALYELITSKANPAVDPAANPAPAPVQPAPTPSVRPQPAAPAPQRPQPTASVRPQAAAPRPVAVAPAAFTAADEELENERVLGLTPGSRLNIPVGFAFIAMAIVIAAILGAYMLGYNKMQKLAKAEKDREAVQEGSGIIDPTAQPLRVPNEPAPNRVQPPTGAPRQPVSVPPPEQPAPAAAKVILVKSPKDDPRKVGLNYPTVATLPIKEATAAAEYLVSKGYPTVVAPSTSDSRLFTVVPLIGLERDGYQKNSETAARSLRELGRAFKRDLKGATDFNDLYWRKFDR